VVYFAALFLVNLSMKLEEIALLFEQLLEYDNVKVHGRASTKENDDPGWA
jgi:hypothetical protein